MRLYRTSLSTACLALIGGCTSVQEGVREAARAAQLAMSAPQEVVGTYELTNFQGNPLPAQMNGMAGQSCSSGAKIVRAELKEGSVELTGSWDARMRGTVSVYCNDGGSETMPQNVDARYTAADGEVRVRMPGNGAPLVLRLDRAAGTLVAANGMFDYRRQAAVSDSERLLHRVVKGLPAEIERTPTVGSRGPTSGPRAIQVAEVFVGSTEAGQGVPSEHVVAFQRGSTWDGDTQTTTYPHPMANVGDAVFVMRGDRQQQAAVLARAPVVPGECGGQIGEPGWLYLLDMPAAEHPRGEHGSLPLWATRAPLPPTAAGRQSRSLRDVFGSRARVVAQNLAQAKGELSSAAAGEVRVIELRGAQGKVFLAQVQTDQNDFYGYYSTEHTWLLDSQGKVIDSSEGYRTVHAVVDVDGNGTEEVVTSSGVLYWDGTRWVMPESDPEPNIC